MFGTNGWSLQRIWVDWSSERVDSRLYGLVVLVTIFGVRHHVDRVIRGNRVGRPLIPEVTPFTYSFDFYPLIALGLAMTLTDRVGAEYWTIISGAGLVTITTLHFGPLAVEPPADVIDPYETAAAGYLAFAWLLGFVASLAATTGYASYRWLEGARPFQRRHSERTTSPAGHAPPSLPLDAADTDAADASQ